MSVMYTCLNVNFSRYGKLTENNSPDDSNILNINLLKQGKLKKNQVICLGQQVEHDPVFALKFCTPTLMTK